MKVVGFHSNQLGVRGTEVALYDYALYNELVLGNKSYIVSSKNNNLFALDKFQKRFEVFLYDSFDELELFVQQKNIEYMYYIKSGEYDGKVLKSCKNLNHVVFQNNQPHGDKYVFIAQWLSQKMTHDNENYVPHILHLPEVKENYRDFLNIPENAIVFGRHGGYDEFDYEWIYPVIERIAQENSNIYFVFLNTKPFCKQLPNIIHLEATYDLEIKTAFINTCDALLHARRRGEIFSLTIGEFLHQDKAVISCPQGYDEGHVVMLKDKGIWYNNDTELYNVLKSFNPKYPIGYWKSLVEEYSPENVMHRFDQLFLK
jgi:hypothetical protein